MEEVKFESFPHLLFNFYLPVHGRLFLIYMSARFNNENRLVLDLFPYEVLENGDLLVIGPVHYDNVDPII